MEKDLKLEMAILLEKIITLVSEEISGRIATPDDELILLGRILAQVVEGNHLEIGVLHGGTAIYSALVKKKLNLGGNVLALDPMSGGWWDDAKDPAGYILTPENTINNIRHFVTKYQLDIDLAPVKSWDFLPDNRKHTEFATALIDGDHSYGGCSTDWNLLKEITTRFIIFHDYDNLHPGVMRTVDVDVAMDKRWTYHDRINSMIAFRRVE
jgi:hypothetical protein